MCRCSQTQHFLHTYAKPPAPDRGNVLLVLDGLITKLGRLRRLFARRADEAYEERDSAAGPAEQAFAAGKAEAFAEAEDEVRSAQKE